MIVRLVLGVLLLAVLLGVAGSERQPPTPAVITLAGGWDFWLDPADTGVQHGWQTSGPDEPPQRQIATGASLSDQGLDSYKGVAWYRRVVSVPGGWQRVVIGFGAIDVQCDLYVNGHLIAHFDNADLGQHAAVADISVEAPPGAIATIVLRLVAAGGAGGIKQQVLLAQNEADVMTGQQYVLLLHDRHPDWLLPSWASGGNAAWIVSAVPGSSVKPIIAMDGSFAASAGSYSIAFWLWDPATAKLIQFPPPSASLTDGSSPLPVYMFEQGPWRLREQIAAYGPAGSPAVAAQLTLEAAPHDAQLFAAVRPYGASPGTARIDYASYVNGLLYVNGQLAMGCGDCSTISGGTLDSGDASIFAEQGLVPPLKSASNLGGWTQGLVKAPLKAGAHLTFLAPSTSVAKLPAGPDYTAISADWQKQLHATQLALPDKTLQNAYYASLGYIVADQHAGVIEPGPLLHNRFWVRDAALIGYALERASLSGSVTATAAATLRAIGSNGEVVSVTDASGKPLPYAELDAAGEAVFGLTEYARYSGDQAFLRQTFPAITQVLRHAMGGLDEWGLVPPNLSAEDLGAASQHHYWDDFWLLTGLSDAQWAAQRLDQPAMAVEFARDTTQLRQSLLASISATRLGYIPDGPEDLDSSAMARGSSVALWPTQVLDPTSPLVLESFDTYYQRLIAPEDGAYHHLFGQWWPYGGLELAHDLLFLGQRDRMQQILTYTLQHQTAPGLFAWAEGVDPRTNGFAEGDMPHAWAAAEVVSLVRDSLLYEDGERLVVGAGVPARWQGQPFSAHGMPTTWGKADLDVAADGVVQVTGISPPGGVTLDLPFAARLASH